MCLSYLKKINFQQQNRLSRKPSNTNKKPPESPSTIRTHSLKIITVSKCPDSIYVYMRAVTTKYIGYSTSCSGFLTTKVGGFDGWLNQFCHVQVTVNGTQDFSYLSINVIASLSMQAHFQSPALLRVHSGRLRRKRFYCGTTRDGHRAICEAYQEKETQVKLLHTISKSYF